MFDCRWISTDMIPEPSNSSSQSSRGTFVTTRWTHVLSAQGDSTDAKSALSDLCAAYYAPVFQFLHREGRTEDQARELTQEFFARLLTNGGVNSVDPKRGRFRSFLLGAVKHFLGDMRDRELAARRGGGQTPVSIDSENDTESGLQLPDSSRPSPDLLFDRQWAVTLLDRALKQLAAENNDKVDQFETLKPWLTGDAEDLSQREAAGRLGMNEGAIKVAVHRLRRRFRELVKAEIAATTGDSSQVRDELRYLLEVLT